MENNKVEINSFKLAIIVLNYSNYNMTINCIDNLINKKCPYDIIIVDNNSPNESYEILRERFEEFDTVKLIKNDQNSGYGSGNNVALRKSDKYDYVCIMNPDIIINSIKIFENLIKGLKKNSLSGITALQITNNHYDNSTLGWKLPNFGNLLILNSHILKKVFKPIEYKELVVLDKERAIAQIDVMPGCFFIMDQKIFEKLNYFDENTFLYYEENILSLKAKNNKNKFGVALSENYIHNHKEKDESLVSFKSKINDRKILMKSQKIYAEKYLGVSIIKKYLLKVSQFINIYIELPIVHLLKKMIKLLKR